MKRLPFVSYPDARGGISLLEVLISIMILSVGVLGVMSLLPLASHQVQRGTQADELAVFGKAAFRDFKIRGMANPANWQLGGHTFQDNASWVIDPRWAAKNGLDQSYFPYIKSAGLNEILQSIPRISLRNPINNTRQSIISPQQADDIFISRDELSIEIPEDEDLPPRQLFYTDPQSEANLKRLTEGQLSWMATLSSLYGLTVGTGTNNKLWSLSIVIFRGRGDNTLNVTTTDSASETNEPFATVASFNSGGISGGDITLSAPNPKALDIAPGQWIMLSGPKLNGNKRPILQWYRVLAVDEEPALVGGLWTREVTLMGPDWDPLEFPQVRATMPRGVVGVYSKTIRLEGPSLWGTNVN